MMNLHKTGLRALLAILVLAAAILVSCGGSDQRTLYLYNWSDYIDEDLVTRFEEETGIRVITDYFDSNEGMYAKLNAGASGYDIAFPTSYMVEIMHDTGMLQDIDASKIPNIKYMDPTFLALQPDRDMNYSVPYMISATGIGFLESRVGDIDEISWDIFASADYAGRMTMLNDYRETIGAALKYLGYSYNSTNEAELEEARDLIISWKENLAKFENDQYKNGLVSGEFAVSQGYSGDILQTQEESDDILFLIPVEGTTISIDNMVLLKDAKNVDEAYEFINYILEPEIAAANIEYVYYLAPNTGAYELLSDEIREDPAVFFSEDVIRNSEILLDLGEDNALYSRIWDEIKAAQ